MPVRSNNNNNQGSETVSPNNGRSEDGNGVYAQVPDDDAGGTGDVGEIFDPSGYFNDGFTFLLAASVCFSVFLLAAGIWVMHKTRQRHQKNSLLLGIRLLVIALAGFLGFAPLALCLYSLFNSVIIHDLSAQGGIPVLNAMLHDAAMRTGAALRHLDESSSPFAIFHFLYFISMLGFVPFLFIALLFWGIEASGLLRRVSCDVGDSVSDEHEVKPKKREGNSGITAFIAAFVAVFFLIPLLFLLYTNVLAGERYGALAQEYEQRIAEIEAAKEAEEAEREVERAQDREPVSDLPSSSTSSEEQAALQKRAESGFVEDAIAWSEAGSYVGQYATFEGVCVEMGGTNFEGGSVTFADLGAAYPDPSRLTVVIWSEDVLSDPSSVLGMFELESMMLGNTVQISGYVYLRDGVANIELSSPSQIRVDGDYYREYFTSAGTYRYATSASMAGPSAGSGAGQYYEDDEYWRQYYEEEERRREYEDAMWYQEREPEPSYDDDFNPAEAYRDQ